MKVTTSVLMMTGVLNSGSAMAACPLSLSADEIVDCIVAEGSGQPYEDYLVDMAALDAETGSAVSVAASEGFQEPTEN